MLSLFFKLKRQILPWVSQFSNLSLVIFFTPSIYLYRKIDLNFSFRVDLTFNFVIVVGYINLN